MGSFFSPSFVTSHTSTAFTFYMRCIILFSDAQRHRAWDIRSEKRLFENDLLVLFCLQERSDKGRIRGHACISCFGIFLFAKEKPVFPVLIPTKQRLALRFHALYDGIVRGMKPRSTSLLLGTIADLARGKSQLLVENALLRQQLIILRRQVKQPTCKKIDRFLLLLLARMLRTWKQALFIVQPDTLLRWHRELFRLFWKRKSKADSRQPKLSPETIALIKEMTSKNRLWGAERMRGELLKLGMRVCKRTIQKYMRHVCPPRAIWAEVGDVPPQSCERNLGL
jgi:hypothetical protein